MIRLRMTHLRMTHVRMIRRAFASALLASTLALACVAGAQSQGSHPQDSHPQGSPPPDRPPHPQRDAAGGPPPPPPPIDELKRALSLDDRQAKAVATIMEAHRDRVEALHARTREAHDALVRETDDDLRKVLNAQQFEAFQAWKRTHRPPPPFGRPGEQGRPRGQDDRRPPMGPPPPDRQGEG